MKSAGQVDRKDTQNTTTTTTSSKRILASPSPTTTKESLLWSTHVPLWHTLIFRLLISVVYFYAALAKVRVLPMSLYLSIAIINSFSACPLKKGEGVSYSLHCTRITVNRKFFSKIFLLFSPPLFSFCSLSFSLGHVVSPRS